MASFGSKSLQSILPTILNFVVKKIMPVIHFLLVLLIQYLSTLQYFMCHHSTLNFFTSFLIHDTKDVLKK